MRELHRNCTTGNMPAVFGVLYAHVEHVNATIAKGLVKPQSPPTAHVGWRVTSMQTGSDLCFHYNKYELYFVKLHTCGLFL